MAAGGERERNLSMQGALAPRIDGPEFARAVLLDERVKTQDAAIRVEGLNESVEQRKGSDPQASVAGAENRVNDVRLDPVEDGQVQKQGSLLFGDAAEQAYADEIRGEGARLRARRNRVGGVRVAFEHDRDRPPAGAALNRLQLAARQRASEKLRDLGSREAELVRVDDDGLVAERVRNQVQPGIRPEPEGDVEIVRTSPQKQVEQIHRAGGQSLHLVENEHALPGMRLDHSREQAEQLREMGGRPGVVVPEYPEIEARPVHRAGEVVPEDVGRIVFVERKPSDRDSLARLPAVEVGEHAGLAEPARGLQRYNPPVQHAVQAGLQRGARQESRWRHRGDHFRLQQPRRADHGAGGERCTARFHRARRVVMHQFSLVPDKGRIGSVQRGTGLRSPSTPEVTRRTARQPKWLSGRVRRLASRFTLSGSCEVCEVCGCN